MKTKIIATLGPASTDPALMRSMIEQGVRVFRLNFSHADAEAFVPALRIIRQLEQELAIPLTAMGDLCGPKIRIGKIVDSPRNIIKGERVLLGLPEQIDTIGKEETCFLPFEYSTYLEGLKEGMLVTLADGLLRFRVTQVLSHDQLFELESLNAGVITSNKGITFPGKPISVAALTDKDRKDVREALERGIDAFALSFVQTGQDIDDLIEEMESCGRRVPIIAKIERQNAVDNLDEILARADGLMVARGDLGLECPLSQVPIIQKKIIKACRHAQKPAIVATQMLLSMVNNVIPTRAEASDVANAILEGADCVMLSEETAIGANPVEVVKTIRQIAADCKTYYQETHDTPFAPRQGTQSGKFMAYATCVLADNFKSKAIVCYTASGLTARYLSTRRSAHDIYALSENDFTLKSLNFIWGVNAVHCTQKEAARHDRLESYITNSNNFESGDSLAMSTHTPILSRREPNYNKIEIFLKA